MNNSDLRDLHNLAKEDDDEATKELIDKFQPLIYKNSYINGELDLDCVQELTIKLYKCIKKFEFKSKEEIKEYLDID
ncbi:MAG: helix-turn-helix domain-containing protein [Mammaliicoccus vitulinus]